MEDLICILAARLLKASSIHRMTEGLFDIVARQRRGLTTLLLLRSGRRDSNPPSAPVRTLRLRDSGLDLVRRAA